MYTKVSLLDIFRKQYPQRIFISQMMFLIFCKTTEIFLYSRKYFCSYRPEQYFSLMVNMRSVVRVSTI